MPARNADVMDNRVSLSMAVLLVAVLLLAGCSVLPPLNQQTMSTALTDTADTRLGKAVHAQAQAQSDKSGIYGLEVPQEAFAARVLLARAAERSLDVQYYIWHGDTTGYLMFEEIWNAAERGVRVRLLLDDNGIAGLDSIIAALDSHPNIEVRLFNPFAQRSFKALGYVTDFSRLNRRMHNKSFTADTQATIVGGRNIGDEYFGAGEYMVFADLDVVAVGRIAGETAAAFDLYWASKSAYPVESILGKASPDSVQAMMAKFAAVRSSPAAVEYVEAVRSTGLIQALIARNLPLEWAHVRLVYDDPVKTLDQAKDANLLFTKMREAIGTPARELDIISPYFVPGKQGTLALSAFPERGVQLRVLTNSLAATDVGAVHAGYAKRREALLRSGAKIYELKPDYERQSGDAKDTKKRHQGGRSSASLHAKTFSVDRTRVFIGSFNLDPRSIHLNTEMGFVIESARLAGAVSSWLDRSVDSAAYEVILARNGHGLEWIERTDQGAVYYSTEPRTGFWKRFGVGLMSLLPIEWLL